MFIVFACLLTSVPAFCFLEFFIMIGTHYGLVLGLGTFIILMGLISSILAATGKKDKQEAVSV